MPTISRRASLPLVWALFHALLITLVLPGGARAQDDFALKNGDRVVFYGDSITDQRLYTTFTETYAVTRFPQRAIRFIHSGWGGDRVTGGGGGPIDVRLDRDVIAYKPTVLTIMLGMNDGSYRAFDESIFQTYARGYEHIVDKVQAALPNVRITLIQPSPYDDVTRSPGFENGYNAVLVRYSQFVGDLARRENARVADLNTPVVAALRKANDADAATAQKILPDRVHPGPAGHLLMAEALLKAWNAPALVSAVEVDAAGKRVARADNTRVSGLSVGDTLSWTQTDNALPFPLDLKDPIVALAIGASDFVEALDQQPLTITGLTAPRYALQIDGEAVGDFTRDELAAGVNLAVLPTPMVQQARDVHALTLRHNEVHYTRWRQLQVPLQGRDLPHLKQALGTLDALEEDLVKQQRAAARPKAHRFTLTPQP